MTFPIGTYPAFLSNQRVWRHFKAALLILPACIAAAAMQLDLPFQTLLFNGGWRASLFYFSSAAVGFYLVVFIQAYGAFVLNFGNIACASTTGSGSRRLIEFAGGSALTVFTGVALGLAGLLTPVVTLPLFLAVLYRHFYRFGGSSQRLLGWLSLSEISLRSPSPRAWLTFQSASFVRTILVLVGMYVIITKGILIDLVSNDVNQLYFSYLEEVRHNHSIWIQLDRPVISDFTYGRGNGIHLFFGSFTSQFAGQTISVIFLFAMAATVRQFIRDLIQRPSRGRLSRIVASITGDASAIMVLCSPAISIDFGKYHVIAGAFLVMFNWMIVIKVWSARREDEGIFVALVLCALAIPIMFPLYAAPAAAFLLVNFLIAGFRRMRKNFYQLASIGLCLGGSCLVSSLFNYFYIGTPGLDPLTFLIPLMNPDRLEVWTSIDTYLYANWIQGLDIFDLPLLRGFLLGGKVREAGASAILWLEQLHPASTSAGFADATSGAVSIGAFSVSVLALGLTIALAIFFFWKPVSSAFAAAAHKLDLVWKLQALLLRSARLLKAPQIVGFLAPFIISNGLIALAFTPSSSRLLVFANIYQSAAYFTVAIFLLSAVANFPLQYFYRNYLTVAWQRRHVKLRSMLLFAMTMVTVGGSFYVSGAELWEFDRYKSSEVDRSPLLLGVAILFGNEILENTYIPSRNDFRKCFEIAGATKPDSHIFPINANTSVVPCQNSSMLPRAKFVHHYESIIAPYYDKLLFGSPSQQTTLFRKLGIDYFYMEYGDYQFWGPGTTDLFGEENLAKYFDVVVANEKYLLLTWAGEGNGAVTKEIAKKVGYLREVARADSSVTETWYRGREWTAKEMLRRWHKEFNALNFRGP